MMIPSTKATTLAATLLCVATIAFADGSENSKGLVNEFFDALTQKDFDRVQSMFAQGATVSLPFAAGQQTTAAPVVFDGVEQLMGYYRGAGQRIAEVGFTQTEVTASSDGGVVFVENVGDMVLPDGQSYENRYVWRFTIEEGQFTEVREYFDPKVADTAFGRN